LVKKPIWRPTLNLVSSIETELARVSSVWARYRATNSRDAIYMRSTLGSRAPRKPHRLRLLLHHLTKTAFSPKTAFRIFRRVAVGSFRQGTTRIKRGTVK
jgi:hypothetical protein